MFFFSIFTPVLGVGYLMLQIHKRDLRGWQHYACFTALAFWVSILFLMGSNRVQSLDVAGNSIKLVDEKLAEVKALTEQNKALAKNTVETLIHATSGAILVESYDFSKTYNSEVKLLKAVGLSDAEIKSFFENIVSSQSRTNSN